MRTAGDSGWRPGRAEENTHDKPLLLRIKAVHMTPMAIEVPELGRREQKREGDETRWDDEELLTLYRHCIDIYIYIYFCIHVYACSHSFIQAGSCNGRGKGVFIELSTSSCGRGSAHARVL